ncbi:MAG: ATP-binding protein [Asticcacaulis sp.]
MTTDLEGEGVAAGLKASLAAIVESSDDAIIGKTLDGIITSWNASAARIFGYTVAEALGQHITLIIPDDRRDEELVIIGKVRAGQRVDHFETKRRHKAGGLIDISLTVSPILDERGRIIGASKIARDVTDQRRTEALLAETSRRKDEFLANMSHELRTPMNAIIGIAHLLTVSQGLSPKDQRLVSMLKQSSDSLMGLINNLLDFSRLESGSLHMEMTEFDLAALIEKAVMLVEVPAREKGLKFDFISDPALMDCYVGDSLRLQQVLTNLLANAVKFTEHGGIEVHVHVKDRQADTTTVLIDVSDTGIGIEPDKVGVIFDKFMQADASTTRRFGGSGLGLSICKALVEGMGGRISVVSRPEVGSTFTVELPLGNAAVQAPAGRKGAAPRVRKNVLVVDDYEPNIVVVTSMLENLGYDYDVAQNGLEAVRRAERGGYDVILMDVQMPGMDGFESTRRIRALESEGDKAATPIVAMTAHVLDKDKAQCYEAGMNNFIPKPFEPALLKDVLAGYIPTGNA